MTRATHPLAAHSTATISDALDKLGAPGSVLGLAPLFNGARLAGRAFTVRYVAAGKPAGTVGDYLDDVPRGDVVVIDNGGRLDCTVWGDILTAMAADREVAGTVIDGVNRDVQRALDLEYPIYSRGRFMRTGKDRVEVSDVGTPITVGGVRVRVGDLVVGDADGVVVVARELEELVLAASDEIASREHAIVEDVRVGMSLAESRSRHGYHQLQRRAD